MGAGKNRLAKRAKPTEIIDHWSHLMENFSFSSEEFYERVEVELTVRKVPDMSLSRVDWKEGGMLSARRAYLRVGRERLIFDICAAPFGTSFFISTWFGEKPLQLGLLVRWLILIVSVAMIDFFIPEGMATHLRWHYGRLWLFAPIAGSFMLSFLALAVWFGIHMDAALLRTPIVSYFYEKYFRAITFYRFDLACMFQKSVQSAVEKIIDEISTEKGIKPLSELERRPVMRELFMAGSSNGRN
jgi:hypothetical protein